MLETWVEEESLNVDCNLVRQEHQRSMCQGSASRYEVAILDAYLLFFQLSCCSEVCAGGEVSIAVVDCSSPISILLITAYYWILSLMILIAGC